MTELKREIEALLFSSGRAMSPESLSNILDASEGHVNRALKELYEEYKERDTALMIFEEAGSWKMLVRDPFIPVVQRVVADTELSRPTLETLAVVAFHYPKILQSEVIHARGSHAYEHIKELENAGFIARTPEGRSFSIKLTEKFFEYFDVEGEADIKEVFKDVTVPEKQVPEHIGDLDVVDVPEPEENPFMSRELGTKPELTAEEQEEQRDFLSAMDDKISAASDRNDELEDDPLFKRGEFEAGDDSEGVESEDSKEPEGAAEQPVSDDPYAADDETPEEEKVKGSLDEAPDVENL